jgi:hypothetical protein
MESVNKRASHPGANLLSNIFCTVHVFCNHVINALSLFKNSCTSLSPSEMSTSGMTQDPQVPVIAMIATPLPFSHTPAVNSTNILSFSLVRRWALVHVTPIGALWATAVADLARVSARSFPPIPEWLGHHADRWVFCKEVRDSLAEGYRVALACFGFGFVDG